MPVIDRATVPIKSSSIYPAPFGAMMAGRSSQRLGQAGGLTRFGVNLVILAPGARSSLRHWHRAEDELVIVLQGECTLLQDAGRATMQPGGVAAFPAGVADGHCFVNLTETEARFLVIGSKAPHEVATYSDVDFVLTMAGSDVTFTRRDGRPYAETPQDAVLPPLPAPGRPQGLLDLPVWQTGARDACRYSALSGPGGLTQFMACLVDLPAGATLIADRATRAEDEMILMLDGQAVLVEATDTPLSPGDAAAWPAGSTAGYRLENRSDAPARALFIGLRDPRDGTPYGETR